MACKAGTAKTLMVTQKLKQLQGLFWKQIMHNRCRGKNGWIVSFVQPVNIILWLQRADKAPE